MLRLGSKTRLVLFIAPLLVGFSLGCGGRTELPADISGAGGASSTSTIAATTNSQASTTGAGGSSPHCDPPLKTPGVIADGLDGAIEVLVRGNLAYVLRTNDVVQVPLCGGAFQVLGKNPAGFGSLRGFAVTSHGVTWATSGPGAALATVALDGSQLSFNTQPGLLSATADEEGVYFANQSGALTALSNVHGLLDLNGQNPSGPIGYWAPLLVADGWVYWASGGTGPFGSLGRARHDQPGFTALVSMRIPDDMAVVGNEAFTVTAHGVDELQRFDVTQPVLQTIAVVPTPVAIAADAKWLYVADAIGIERAPHDASAVTPLIGNPGMLDVTVTDDALVWLSDDGLLTWLKKPH